MKNSRSGLLLAVLFLTITVNFAQTTQQEQKQDSSPKKKKGEFWNRLGDAALKDLGVRPDNTSGSPGSTFKSGKGIVVENSWLDYGGAGTWQGTYRLDFTTPSPRNHMYYFDIDQPNAKVKFITENDMNGLAKEIVTEYNGQVQHYQNDYTLQPGTHKLQFAPRFRYTRGKYRAELMGPVKNLRKVEYPRFVTERKNFGDEGSGGAGSNMFSSRNHRYRFEGEVGSVIDVNVESNGVKLKMALVDPFGAIAYSLNGGGGNPGMEYIIHKVEKPGIYRIYVATDVLDGKGEYTLDLMGKTKSEPIQDTPVFTKVEGEFTKSPKQQEYRLIVDNTILEMIYRSTTTPSDVIEITDSQGKTMDPHMQYDATKQIRNRSWLLKEPGEYKLKISTQEPEGNYDLLFWGNLKAIELISKTSTSQAEANLISTAKSNSVTDNINETTASEIPAGKVKVVGRINVNSVEVNITDLNVIYENLSTGEILGTVSPTANGGYTILVDNKINLGVTATAPDNSIVTSLNIDLSKVKSGIEVKAKPIEVLPFKAGTAFSLNNIFFETGNPVLLRASYPELKRIASVIKANPGLKIEISGHTDNVGSVSMNKDLSENRAKAVLYYLQDQVPEAKNLISKGYGSSKPIEDNGTEQGKQMNRRVEFRILN